MPAFIPKSLSPLTNFEFIKLSFISDKIKRCFLDFVM